MMMIGEKIRVLRKQHGWTQEEFAEVLGLHTNTIIRWETNRRTPTLNKIKALAEVLDTTPEYLIGGDNEGATPLKTPSEGTPDEGTVTAAVPLTFWADVAEKAKATAKAASKEELSAVRALLQLALSAVEDACLSTGADVQRLPVGAGGGAAQSESGKAV